MSYEVITYDAMCRREGLVLQRGMYFRPRGTHSVVLASLRANAPYADAAEEQGRVFIYQGHDAPRSKQFPEPWLTDQPKFTAAGRLTENGRFYHAALNFKFGISLPEEVRVYQKLQQGVWTYNGRFRLKAGWKEQEPVDGGGERRVFKFRLVSLEQHPILEHAPTRRIPSRVKVAVWKRDRGRCVICGATDDLHFDHIIPLSKGGSSYVAENIQLLCARHNLQKGDGIA